MNQALAKIYKGGIKFGCCKAFRIEDWTNIVWWENMYAVCTYFTIEKQNSKPVYINCCKISNQDLLWSSEAKHWDNSQLHDGLIPQRWAIIDRSVSLSSTKGATVENFHSLALSRGRETEYISPQLWGSDKSGNTRQTTWWKTERTLRCYFGKWKSAEETGKSVR